MARNEEKAQAMLNKWTTMKKNLHMGPKLRRPFLASDCDDLNEAEKWRRDVMRDITKSVSDIQNAGLGEHRIRDLNDQINKLIREKGHWQARIRDLGGTDYTKQEQKFYDADGKELPGSGGYKYFGAAKELPGVRELFQKQEREKPRRTRGDIYKGIGPDYYGFHDEEDGILLEVEAIQEKRLIEESILEYKETKRRRLEEKEANKQKNKNSSNSSSSSDIIAGIVNEQQQQEEETDSDSDIDEDVQLSAMNSEEFRAYLPVPDQTEITKQLLEKKKKALLNAFNQTTNGGK